MIELGKKYQTRDGRAVRILATDFKAGATCIIGAIAMGDNNEIVGLWDARGVVFGSCDHLEDLVPVPTKHEGWILLSLGEKKEPLSVLFDSLEEAEEMSYSKSVGMKRPIVAHVIWED